MSYKPESRMGGETTTSDMQMIPESKEELKRLLIRVKVESERAGLKLILNKLRLWHPAPLLYGK